MLPVERGGTLVVEERRNHVPDDERVAYESQPRPADGDSLLAEREQPPTGLRQRVQTALEIIRANPTGRIALKIVVAVVGAVVVLVGLALIPLPGPGWLLVIAGLGVWAVEYHWARRLLTFTRRNVQAWTRWATRQSWPVRLLLGAFGLVFVSVVVWLSLKFSLGIDLVAEALHYLATH
ncbi:TIGR02611 family protein [Micromonospora sp. NPDC049523]|uniref:TIGR02611 family protein n=1 Tax=Micromonospora sp. NPDC049523 TaxID=3155921 RepID=UPI00342589F3